MNYSVYNGFSLLKVHSFNIQLIMKLKTSPPQRERERERHVIHSRHFPVNITIFIYKLGYIMRWDGCRLWWNVKSWLINRFSNVAKGNTETHLVINTFWPIDFRFSIRACVLYFRKEINKRATGKILSSVS